jgi:hypothetical protein
VFTTLSCHTIEGVTHFSLPTCSTGNKRISSDNAKSSKENSSVQTIQVPHVKTAKYTVKPCSDIFENSKKIWLLKREIS